VTPSSGNVFADIGVPRAEAILFKADLAIAIGDVIRRRKLTQGVAAEIVGIDQAKVSTLLSGDTRGFSADRLIKILTRLGQDVEIRVHNSRTDKGRIRVAA
jgi:predicted XRE-type DNA-binding protein